MNRVFNTHITNISFQNSHTIYENFTKCTIKDYEYNISYNPTLLSGSQGVLTPYSSSDNSDIVYITSQDNFGILKDFTTSSISGSEFSPYVTTIGLYNDEQDLLATAKMASPIPISSNTDMTFLVKWDTNFVSPKVINDNYDINGITSVNIEGQIWMDRNLDVVTYRNGDPIPQVTSDATWKSLTTGAWCWYANSSSNGVIYSRLYNWYAVTDPRGLAPIGWRIPTISDFTTLRTNLGGINVAGGKLKESSTTYWRSPNTGATNSSGFTALPTGYRFYNSFLNTLFFTDINNFANYWTSEAVSSTLGYSFVLGYNSNSFQQQSTAHKRNGFGVRCIREY